MSLLYFDGFDGYDTYTDLPAHGKWVLGFSSIFTFSSAVRTGTGKALVMLNTTSANRYLAYNFAADQIANTVYVGFAFNPELIITNTQPILRFHAGANPGDGNSAGNMHCALGYDSASKCLILYGPANTVLETGITPIAAGVWVYIEVKIKIDDTTGIVELKIDGLTQFTFSGDTKNVTNTFLSLAFTCGITTTWRIDDVYILNSDGTTNNTYLGEQRCEIMTPTSDSTVAWARNTGASNFSAVDDPIGAPDDDTTYVFSSTAGQKDEYGLSDLTGVAGVAGVKLITRAEKDDANPLSVKTGIKSGAIDQQVAHALGVGYANYIDIFETSDGAGTAFTPTTVNSLLSTIEVV